jgi:signal transduction histidine kinase
VAGASLVTLNSPERLPLRPREGRGLRFVGRLSAFLTHRSVVPIALGLTLVIGIGDFETGVEIPFTILYVLPIGIGVWYRDQLFGMLLSCLATCGVVVSLVQDYTPLAVLWNAIGALVLFLAITWLLDRLRVHVQREQAERRLAVDQLRHGERLKMIGTLAAGVAHELGTPLNVIAGCAEILAEDSSDAVIQRRTHVILDQASKITTIIRQLLDFGHRGGIARAAVDVNALVTSTAEMLRSTARKRGHTIALELGEPAQVTASAAELEQVLSNLILNGLQAMDRSGCVRLRTTVEPRFDPRGERHRVACIAVADEGRGIAPEDLGRIFDPFFTTKGVGEGTGLGLSVSYGIVRDHGGSIEVTSESRRGSRFAVVLPLRA